MHIERPDGSRIIVVVNVAPVRNERGNVTGAINCFYDVTERKRVEEALRESVRQCQLAEETLRDSEARLRLANEELESVVQRRTATLRYLSAKLMRVQDEERRRIARNLQDSLGQYLEIAKMNLKVLSLSATTEQAESLSAALESVERSMVETRTLSCLLHPLLLEDSGFASAARWYADEFGKRSNIEVKLNLADDLDRLPQLAEIALFRILQESLTNVHQHSGSTSVEINLSLTKNQALLSVRDFGRGMPHELMQGSDLSHVGVGLSGMRERVADLGGSFTIESNSHGTAIIVALPLNAEHSKPEGLVEPGDDLGLVPRKRQERQRVRERRAKHFTRRLRETPSSERE
jgi:signal transduction histidine kinase